MKINLSKTVKIFVMASAIAVASVLSSQTRAQYIRINKASDPTALYFNLNRVFNYNHYEEARFGGELYWVAPANAAGRPQLQLSAYGAYGTYDLGWKYGLTAALQFAGTQKWRPYISFYDDLNQSASINLGVYALLSPSFNTCYVASRFARIRSAEAGVSATFGRVTASLDVRYFREWLLYDANGYMIYPNRNPEVQPSFHDFAEGHLRASWRNWTADVRVGTDGGRFDNCYLRAILQYSNSFKLNQYGSLSVFGQAGFASSTTHRQHLFDISGTWGSYYFFNNTLLTIPTNSFVTDRFVRFTGTYNFSKYLWNLPISHPQPFVQLGGAVGYNCYTNRMMSVFEPALGINGLLRWGYLDLGVAAAYRISPNNDDFVKPVNLSGFRYPFAVLFVAKLII